jgi:RES domain-containing protein
MIVEAWRLSKLKYAASAFDGAGAARYPGRWNKIGQRVVYTSDSPSLAVLELVVHADDALSLRYGLIRCAFDDTLVEEIDTALLPVSWQALVDPAYAPLQLIGGEWFESARSAVFKVPSAIVPEQHNFLINPTHPDFRFIAIGPMTIYKPDARLNRYTGEKM